MSRHEEDMRLLQISREIEEGLQRTVKIPHSETLRICAADLLSKYKTANRGGQSSEAEMLECVLTKYYLTQDEFELYTS